MGGGIYTAWRVWMALEDTTSMYLVFIFLVLMLDAVL